MSRQDGRSNPALDRLQALDRMASERRARAPTARDRSSDEGAFAAAWTQSRKLPRAGEVTRGHHVDDAIGLASLPDDERGELGAPSGYSHVTGEHPSLCGCLKAWGGDAAHRLEARLSHAVDHGRGPPRESVYHVRRPAA